MHNPFAAMPHISNITYATTGATGASFTGLPAGVTGSWAANVATISGAPTVSGDFNYTVTLTGSGCNAFMATGTLKVTPTPNVTHPANQLVCKNGSTAPVNFSGGVSGTVYSWTNSNPAIGLAASGVGNIPSFTALNPSATPVITATITVTPTFTGGNMSCVGTPVQFTITVFTPTIPLILGPATLCPNLINIPYSVTPQIGITNYQWSYSGTGVMIHNNGNPDITLDFSPGATAGILTVQLIHPCGGANVAGNLNIQVGNGLTCAFINCLISNIFVTDNTFTVPGMPQIFKVSDKITSNATTTAPKTVIFKAGNSVDLLAGFKVNQGAVFVAEIEGVRLYFHLEIINN